MSAPMSPSTSRPITRIEINPGNAFLAWHGLERYVAATNRFEPWAGTTGTVSYCTDAAGTTPIPGLANFALIESGEAGWYYAEIPSASADLLTPYDGQVVYQVVVAGTNADVRDVKPMQVVLVRWV